MKSAKRKASGQGSLFGNDEVETEEIIVMIFCIGMGKTGTKTICSALMILGYRTSHHSRKFGKLMINYLDSGVMKPFLAGIFKKKDVFADGPERYRFKELDEHFPEAKFILTIRGIDTWLVSHANHSYVRHKRTHVDGDFWRQRLKTFREHHEAVRGYFRGREDFLEIDFCDKDDKWKPICGFLNKEVPDCTFPRRGRTRKISGKHFMHVEEVMEFFGLSKEDVWGK